MYCNVLSANTYEASSYTNYAKVTPCFCASWSAPLGAFPFHFRCQSHGGYNTLTVPGGVTWTQGTVHDVVMPPHCLILVYVTVLYLYVFIIYVLSILVTFTYVQ